MKTRIHISVDPAFVESVDEVCKRTGCDRSEFLVRSALLVMTRRADVAPLMPTNTNRKAVEYAAEAYPA